jgi:hypothetical protein
MVISIILLMLAGIIWGFMDSGAFYNNPPFMNYSNYWKLKYKDGDPSQGYKWFGLSQFIVLDGWHIGKILVILFLCASGMFFSSTSSWYLDIAIMFFIVQIPFQIMLWILRK